jgi:hypothetical protein
MKKAIEKKIFLSSIYVTSNSIVLNVTTVALDIDCTKPIKKYWNREKEKKNFFLSLK